MIKILFVCHGNICRSPMAEFAMKRLVEERGIAGRFEIASAATSMEEIGNPVYPPVRRLLKEYGIRCDGKQARRITQADYKKYDYLIGMDHSNIRDMLRIFGGDPDEKISLLLEHAGYQREVFDPWYTRDFHAAWRDVTEGCEALLREFTSIDE